MIEIILIYLHGFYTAFQRWKIVFISELRLLAFEQVARYSHIGT